MMPSEMTQSFHKVVVESILEISWLGFQTSLPSVPRGFKSTLDLITSDLREQIIIYEGEVVPGHIRVGEARSEANRLARRPETPVMDSWLVWFSSNGSMIQNPGCWWVSCSFQKTVDFINKIFNDSHVGSVRNPPPITWGTFIRYLRFISKNSEGWIPSIVEGECSWEDHSWNVKNHLLELMGDVGHPVSDQRASSPEYWTQKFNTEESDKVIGMNPDWRFKLGYLVPVSASEPAPESAPEPVLEPEPEPEPEPEMTPTQKNNDSIRKLQEIIDAVTRGETPELNEGDYLQLSQSLKEFYVS